MDSSAPPRAADHALLSRLVTAYGTTFDPALEPAIARLGQA